MRLSEKKDGKILERAILENDKLKDTLTCSIPKLRNPRIICFVVPNNVSGEDVVEAAVRQSGPEDGSVRIKFPIKRKYMTNWVLVTALDAFRALINLRRLVIG